MIRDEVAVDEPVGQAACKARQQGTKVDAVDGGGLGLGLGSATPGVPTEAALVVSGVLITGAAGVKVTGEGGGGGGAKPNLPYERVTLGRTSTLMVLRYIRICGMSYTVLHDRHVSASRTGTGGHAAQRGR